MDAAAVGKLQDDRNKRPTNDETEKGSLVVGEPLTVSEFANLLKWIRGEDEDLEVADCDLKEEPKEYTVKTFPRQYEYLDEGEPIQKGDEYYSDVLKKWTPATLLFERVPSSSFYRRPIKSCCSKLEPQLDRCKDCSKPLTYNWLMGFLCEDCELKHSDPYETH
jgi:hypothetical protein